MASRNNEPRAELVVKIGGDEVRFAADLGHSPRLAARPTGDRARGPAGGRGDAASSGRAAGSRRGGGAR